MNLFELVAKLTLDSSEYDRALMAAKGTTTKAGGSMVADIEKTKKRIGMAAMAMSGAMVAFGVSSVKTGMQFDQSMSQVAATLGYSVEEINDKSSQASKDFAKLRDFAQEMGRTTKFSAIESADALNYMALAGYDADKSMRMLPKVLNLAAAGSMDLATASDMVTDASSALGLSEKETTIMIDQMASAASKSNTSVSQLGEAMLRVGGTAKVLRGGTAELSTVLGLLADNGTKGAEGGTALRNILTSIQGKKFEKTFGALGIEAYDAQGKLRPLKDIFLDMNEAMDGWSDEKKTEIINKTFNARDLKNVNALLGTTSERWDELSASIMDSEGAAQDMADMQMDNLAGDITLLKSAFEGLKISISDNLTPALRPLVQALTWCIEHASILGPIILGLATAFIAFAVAVNIGTIIQNVTKAFAAFNAVLAANPIGLIIAGIILLATAFITLYKNNETFRNKVLAVWNSLKEQLAPIMDSIKTIFTSAWTIIQELILPLIKQIVSVVVERIAFLVPIFKTIASIVIVPLFTVLKTVLSIWAKIFSAIAKHAGKIKSVVTSAFSVVYNKIVEPISKAYKKIKPIVDKIKDLFPLKIGKIFSNLKIPKIKVSGGKAPFGIGGLGKAPKIDVSWNKKAENVPYLFTNATLFGAGEHKDEMLYGREALMSDIREATDGNGGVQITNYITVDGAENPEDFAERFVRKMKLDMRTI